jgi:hypothetical protein
MSEQYIDCPKCGYVGKTAGPAGCLLTPFAFLPGWMSAFLPSGKPSCPKCGHQDVKIISKAEYEALL